MAFVSVPSAWWSEVRGRGWRTSVVPQHDSCRSNLHHRRAAVQPCPLVWCRGPRGLYRAMRNSCPLSRAACARKNMPTRQYWLIFSAATMSIRDTLSSRPKCNPHNSIYKHRVECACVVCAGRRG